MSPEPLIIHGPVGTADITIDSLTFTLLPSAASPPPAKILVNEWVFSLEDAHNPISVPATRGIIAVCRRPPDQVNPKFMQQAAAMGAPVTAPRVIAKARTAGSDYRSDPGIPVHDGLTWTVMGAGGVRVRSAQLSHRLPCWGYVFQEPPTLSGGERGGRKVVLLGDTCDSTAIAQLAHGADMISHEATFLASMRHKAAKATHSTGAMAGAFAQSIQARQLVLTHFSGRYGHGGSEPEFGPDGEGDYDVDKGDLQALKREAKRASGGQVPIACAHDGFTWRL